MNTSTNILVENSNEDEKDNNEEKEKEEVESEESEDEKEERFFLSLIDSSFYSSNYSFTSVSIIEGVSTYSLEIQLPPPEYNI